jgi:hypothetical protein
VLRDICLSVKGCAFGFPLELLLLNSPGSRSGGILRGAIGSLWQVLARKRR